MRGSRTVEMALIGLSVFFVIAGGAMVFPASTHDTGQFMLGAVVFIFVPVTLWLRRARTSHGPTTHER